jgi:biotin carboxylase
MRTLVLGSVRGSAATLRGLDDWCTVVGPSGWRRVDPALDRVEAYREVCDVASVEEALLVLERRGDRAQGFTEVVGLTEDTIVPAAVLAELFGASGVQVRTAVRLRDKELQKRAIRAAGLRVADSCEVPALDDSALDRAERLLPGVIKPVAGMAAAATAYVDDALALRRERETMRAARIPSVLVESRIAGRELFVDGVVQDGRLVVAGVSAYGQPLLEINSGWFIDAMQFDPGAHREIYDDVLPFAESAVAALGHRDGVLHLELFRDEQGMLTFGECGGRPGGCMVVETFNAKFGVDLVRAAIDAARGVAVVAPRPRAERLFGWTLLPAPPGWVRALPDPVALRRLPGVEQVVLEVGEGAVMGDMRNDSTTRAGMALVSGSDLDELQSRLSAVAAAFGAEIAVEELT